MTLFRYPGPKPFTTAEAKIFYGRGEDIDQLSKLVQQQRLMVLFGRSGLGKSSLLNAGLIPRLTEIKESNQGSFHPLSIRFKSWTEDRIDTPTSISQSHLELPEGNSYLEKLVPRAEDYSLWRHFKTFQELVPTQTEFVLLFDQFEELFSFPEDQILDFRDQLSELLYSEIPQRYRSALQEKTGVLSSEELALLYQPLDVRGLFAIRSDRLHQLDSISDRLGAILKYRYELKPLSRIQAEDAILDPAYSDELVFETPRFDYTDEALDKILNHLSQNGQALIGSFELQVICQYVERGLLPGKEGVRPITIEAGDLGDLSKVFQNYYHSQIKMLGSESEQAAARILIEDHLIYSQKGVNRRLSMITEQILNEGVSVELLQKLVNSYLLRSEPNPRGEGFTYELAHDVLMGPILDLKRERKEEENQQRLLKEKIEAQEHAERQIALNKAKTRRRYLILAVGVVLLAVVLGSFAFQQASNAKRQADLAKLADSTASAAILARNQADSSNEAAQKAQLIAIIEKNRADSLYQEALRFLKEADIAKYNALVQKDSALSSRMRAIAAESIAFKARDDVRRQLLELQEANLSIVRSKVMEASRFIDQLLFSEALELLSEAKELNVEEDGIQNGLAELLYIYINLEDIPNALKVYKIYQGNEGRIPSNTQDTLSFLQELMASTTEPQQLIRFKSRYYPVLIGIEGSEFEIGADTAALSIDNIPWGPDEVPVGRLIVDNYSLGESEVTINQYLMFVGIDQLPLSQQQVKSTNGENPVVNISWNDAIRYCNWLSEKEGLTPVYQIGIGAVVSQLDNNGYRLPTEAEWEYAASEGGQSSVFAGSSRQDEVAWTINNSGGVPMNVKQKKANAFGLYDMSGNVSEWCQDWYGKYDSSRLNSGRGPVNGNFKVLRGGAFSQEPYRCRVSFRIYRNPSSSKEDIGFRIAKNR